MSTVKHPSKYRVRYSLSFKTSKDAPIQTVHHDFEYADPLALFAHEEHQYPLTQQQGESGGEVTGGTVPIHEDWDDDQQRWVPSNREAWNERRVQLLSERWVSQDPRVTMEYALEYHRNMGRRMGWYP